MYCVNTFDQYSVYNSYAKNNDSENWKYTLSKNWRTVESEGRNSKMWHRID